MTETPLGAKLKRLIDANGPMSVADYMAHCLGDPAYGYYSTRDPFGAAGDFITAPEVSQMFGEIVGAWLIHMWREIDAPSPVNLVELGPGRGTLMADILRVASNVPEFHQAITAHLIETSPVLRKRQQETLSRVAAPIAWHSSFDAVQEGPLLLVANEFFDALPIHQFARADGAWRERMVGVDRDGRLAFGLGAAPLDIGPAAPEGTILELRPGADSLVGHIAGLIWMHGGAALIIDYGNSNGAFGDTLQAVHHHQHVEPLAAPGEADLTAHVDFAALASAAAGAAVHGPIAQRDFLLPLGLAERADRLGARANDETRAVLRAAVERLTSGDQMGTLFKVIAITPPEHVPPPFKPSV